jgi:stringent starvation protein B
MTSSRPYLVRAIHEWILDNEMTPHLLVDIEGEGVEVPAQQGQNGKIVNLRQGERPGYGLQRR